MFRKLKVQFATLIDFQREYQRNIANGGLFVPCNESFELREVVEVELDLKFCGRTVPIQSEVVSKRDRTSETGPRGVAVQFLDPIDDLRHLFSELVGITKGTPDMASAPWLERPGPTRRHDRSTLNTPITVVSSSGVASGRTTNLSRSGALISLDDVIPPKPGEAVTLELMHPQTGSVQRVSAKVVRTSTHVTDSSSAALAFELDAHDEEAIAKFVHELQTKFGVQPADAISGSIHILGLPSIVQMFSSAAEAGTLTVHCGDSHGRVVFANGGMQCAWVGEVNGLKALSRMLTWKTGRFEFVPVVDPNDRADEPIPMYGALLESVQFVDELQRLDLSGLLPNNEVSRTASAAPADLEKLDQDVLALADRGGSVARIVDEAPGFDSQVYSSLLRLLDLGLIALDA